MAERYEQKIFLSTLPASATQRRISLLVLAILAAIFVLLAPFAYLHVAPIPAILPSAILPAYEAARLVTALTTAGLLFALYAVDRSPAVLALAAGYLFSGLTVIPPYVLAIAKLLSPLGFAFNGPQAAAWLDVIWPIIWHVIFGLAVLGYAVLKGGSSKLSVPDRGSAIVILSSVVAVTIAVVLIALLVVAGHPLLAQLKHGGDAVEAIRHNGVIVIVALNLLVFGVLWFRQNSLLDLWLIVVMGCSVFGVSLSGILSPTQFSLGYYTGHIYELMAASLVLVVMLLEAMALYGRLVQANSRLWGILETTPEGIAIFDRDDRLVVCNEYYRELFPKVPEMIVPGLRFGDLVRANLEHGSFKLSDTEAEKFLADRLALHRSLESLTDLHLSDGRRIQVHKRRRADSSVIGVWTDVTELRRREEELRESTRINEMQSVLFHLARVSELGQIVSSLIHEVSQPLAAIRNYLAGLQRLVQMEKFDAVGPVVEKAAEQAARASSIVHRLRDFIVKREAERKVESLPHIIEDAAALALVGIGGQEVEVCTRFDPRAAEAFVDRVQIEQVLFNLMRNAAEAMATSPRRELTISTARLEEDRIEVCVADTGPGLSPSVRARLFEPFVTTKATGMGVGLSVCRSVVEAQGGGLHAEDNPGGGTIFRFSVPASPPAVEEAGAAENHKGDGSALIAQRE